jgi:hypothetical protein
VTRSVLETIGAVLLVLGVLAPFFFHFVIGVPSRPAWDDDPRCGSGRMTHDC